MGLSTLALAAILVLTGPPAPQVPAAAQDPGVLGHCVITPLHYVDVAAEEQGKIVELNVTEGQLVQKDQLIALLDDRVPRMQEKVAQYKLDAALAEAKNDINVRYAMKGFEVTRQNYQGMKDANEKREGVYPASEIREKRLEVEKFELQIEQARHDLELAALKAGVQQGELEAAQLEILRRRVFAPFDGIVVERFARFGQWVKPGDKIVYLVALDRLLAKGTINGAQLSPADVERKRVTVQVQLARGRVEQFEGVVTHASPEYKAGGMYDVWAEVYNRQENDRWLLGTNMDGQMTIHWQQPPVPR